jgi:transposase InsO family protein
MPAVRTSFVASARTYGVGLLDEPFRKRVGQRRHGKLLLVDDNRTDRSKGLRTRDAARADVFDYIERFYSTIRRHSTIGYLKPG